MDASATIQVLVRVLLDRPYAELFLQSPRTAAESIGLPLSEDDLAVLTSLPDDKLISIAEFFGRHLRVDAIKRQQGDIREHALTGTTAKQHESQAAHARL
ncbi:hypothetical protein GCM10007907_32180 [Chitinimonas prasina]|uniref:Extradiol ring-cleavage dioxygenase LigAB LigA subunit domain-containing protein n=1 Tax=Chitinimonas prasina TaxID=1434937 RepID=A0ABQ5YIZ9_9NEIS|nr:hypothetical protein [Chitinimonas prasina]GLR14428.1 hypothetical protein GCM10007907_32180 [Chitinimonas prasina]